MDLQCSTIVGPKIIICWTIAYACLVDLQALLVTASLKGDGPANDTKLGVHILPMAFPWT